MAARPPSHRALPRLYSSVAQFLPQSTIQLARDPTSARIPRLLGLASERAELLARSSNARPNLPQTQHRPASRDCWVSRPREPSSWRDRAMLDPTYRRPNIGPHPVAVGSRVRESRAFGETERCSTQPTADPTSVRIPWPLGLAYERAELLARPSDAQPNL